MPDPNQPNQPGQPPRGPMPPTQQDLQRQAEEAKKAFEDANAQMTDYVLADRVRSVHPNAATNADAAKAMLDDYNRLKAEADKAKQDQQAGGTAQRPMGTSG